MTFNPSGARRLTVAVAVALTTFATAMLVGSAGSAWAQDPGAEQAKGEVFVSVTADRFLVRGGKVVADGDAAGAIFRRDGASHTLAQKVPLQVDTTNNCRVLDLHLAELYLDLLGLQVRTSTINVKVTGDRKQALGRLFCKLSQGLKLGKLAEAKRAARSLNARLRDKPLQLVGIHATVHEQEQGSSSRASTRQGQAPPPPPDACHVLDLLLGPLDLDLLGLVVELYGATENDPIRVNVVADPNGGEMGRTFCQLSA